MDLVLPAVPSSVVGARRVQSWEQLVARQSGVLHIRQLSALGVTPAAVAAQVSAARWQPVLRGVYAVFTGPLPRDCLISAALLYGGPAAVLSHGTAAQEWGLPVAPDGPVHLTVPYGASAISQPGHVTVHRSRAYRHIVVASDPPRTSRADTAIDVAVEEPDARRAHAVLVSLLVAGVRPVEVEQQLLMRPPRRHRRALAGAVTIVREGVMSSLEELFAIDVERAHGLPAARRQVPMSVDGVTFWEDATYDHVGAALTVRLDGRMHVLARVAFRDRRRDNAAELAGRARLTFGWDEVSADACGVAREVATVLCRLGWSGRPGRCRRCR